MDENRMQRKFPLRSSEISFVSRVFTKKTRVRILRCCYFFCFDLLIELSKGCHHLQNACWSEWWGCLPV